MPDDYSANGTTSDESFPTMAFERTKNSSRRRWRCPGDETIAAYVDGTLPEGSRTRLETHLSMCEGCRSVVADVIKLNRDAELPLPPLAAAKKILLAPPRTRRRSAFIWGPAVAMALIVFVAASILLRYEPQQLGLTPPPTPSSPIVAQMHPVNPENSTVGEITRQSLIPSLAPVILSPRPDSTVERDELQFTWKPFGRPRYYEISVVTADGDLRWAGKTQAPSLHLPRKVLLKRGSYFVWVTAHLMDGQVAKSSPVRFVVDR